MPNRPIGCVLAFLTTKKEMEPILLVPMGFGAILVIWGLVCLLNRFTGEKK